MYKYVLFDLDGTLSDPKEGICGSVRYALEKSGIEPPPIDELTSFIGPPLSDSFREFYHMNEEEAGQAVAYYRERFSDKGWAENRVYDGIPQLLASLKKQGVKLAVASSKPTVFVERILSHFGMRKYFAVVVGSELDGKRSKKEEVVKEALRQLYGGKDDSSCRECTAMVGDRRFDIEGARAEKLDAIGVSYGYAEEGELTKAGADAVAATVEELRELLLGGEDRELYALKSKRAEAEARIPLSTPPENGLFRALYMLSPFVLYFVFLQCFYGIGTWVVTKLKEGGSPELILWMSSHSRLLGVWINCLVMLCCGAGLWLIYRKKEPLYIRPLWKKRQIAGKCLFIVALGIVLSALLNTGINSLAKLIIPLFFDAEKTQAFFDSAAYDRSTPLLPGLVLYVLVSPALEELVFRWLLCGRIRRVFSEGLTIVLTALFFGCYHGNILQGIYAFLMGLVLGKLMLKEEGLFAPLLFHMTANAFIFLSNYG
ncbi:MAG: HAD hydrolase-like protein [Lachnospiraceae bacterium]|nr:HAD hydrolase-like protein [Lachnospiraceae bacterium]